MSQFSGMEYPDDNPEPRCPVVLLLDTSGSMVGKPIDELNNGLQVLQSSLAEDPLVRLRVEISIITFGPVSFVQDFATVDSFNPPMLVADGDTPMASATLLALDKLEERKKQIKQMGISYYRPWVFLITDGGPTDGSANWQMACSRIEEAEKKKKVAFFAVGVENADMQKLAELSVREPLKLNGLNFKDMFVWLSASLTNVSHSSPGDEVSLQSPMGWAEL